jgi:hypothetical protein
MKFFIPLICPQHNSPLFLLPDKTAYQCIAGCKFEVQMRWMLISRTAKNTRIILFARHIYLMPPFRLINSILLSVSVLFNIPLTLKKQCENFVPRSGGRLFIDHYTYGYAITNSRKQIGNILLNMVTHCRLS